MVGFGKAVILHPADGALDLAPGQGHAQGPGHPGGHHRLVRRLAVHVLGQDPHPPAGRHDQLAGDGSLGQFRRHVHGRIAHAHHHHGLAAHVHGVEGVAIAVGVEGGSVEMTRVVRDAGVPVVAVADEQHVIGPGLAGGQGHPPQAVPVPLRPGHAGVEGDLRPQAEMVHIVAEILQQLAVMGKVRPVRRDRKILEGQPPLGGVDVQALVAGGEAVGVPVVPVAADVVGQLETVEGDAHVLQPLGGGEAGTAGADDARAGKDCSHGSTLPVPRSGKSAPGARPRQA